jgi:predicted dehydrogenase
MKVIKKINRRDFLKKATGVGLGTMGLPYIIPSSALGKVDSVAASNRVVIGCIGVGPRGRLDTRGMMQHGAQVVAVCDVDAKTRTLAKKEVEDHYARKKGREKYTGCATYNDFRDLLARDDIDAVLIATPDHWHVPIAISAVKAGKDIYVEKPLGVTIAEGQALRDVVRRYGVVFMHGTEQRSFNQFRFACELVLNKRIGELQTIKVACPGGQETGVYPPMPVPKGLDWDMWLGPAPWVPYTKARLRPGPNQGWYFISDYASSGFVAGWGIHHVDMAQWALDADHSGPVRIDGRGVFPKNGLWDTPLTWNIDYVYANGVRVNFTDNSKNHQGVRFEGTEGWIHVTRSSIEAEPKSVLRSVIGPDEVNLYKCGSDDGNFVECVKTRSKTCSPIEAAHRSTTVCYLGYISIVLGRELRWDPDTERFVNDEQANRMLSRSIRSPWHL